MIEYQSLREVSIALDGQEKALELQAAELARRLDVLNHAHQQAIAEQARTVPRELFEQYKASQATALGTLAKEQQQRLDEVRLEEQTYRKRIDDKLSVIEGLIATNTARSSGSRAAFSSAGSVIMLIVTILSFVAGVFFGFWRK